MPIRILPTLFLVAFVAAGLLTPAPPPQENSDIIKIISSMPRTGSARGQTDTIVDGIRLALHEVQNSITLGDRTYRIEYIDLDDATASAGDWTSEQEASNARQAQSDADVMVYIGTYNSGAAKISMPILNRMKVLMISPANTAPGLTKPNQGERDEPKRYRPSGEVNYVRVVPTDDLQGPAGAEWSLDMGCQRVYILDDNSVYGKGVADLFEGHARKIGINVLGRESIDSKASEFLSLMTKIATKQPQLIYFGGTTQTKAGQVAKDMVKVGMKDCKIMGPDGTYEEAMIQSASPEVLNGRFFCTFGGLTPDKLAETPGGKAFVDNYKQFYGKVPSEAYALYGYECGRVALEAIRRAGKKDRAAICKAGREIKDFPGVTGTWSFDENGDTTQQDMSGITVQNGKFVFAKRLTVTRK